MAGDRETGAVSETQPVPGGPASADPPVLEPGTVLGGRYVIEAKLGRGGMGTVLRARDSVLGEAVALKVLRPEYAAERCWAERLAREVRLARQVRHPNVCRVFDFEQADGHTFVVMELAGGGSLRAELDARRARDRPLAERLADARAVADGLAAIHDAGIVHRDVSPQNVLRMGDGRLVVSDFGLAIDADQTTTSVQGGTVSYMSPEVVRGARATFASDVWSLGMVLHEIVFGEKPRWRSATSFELVPPDTGRTRAREEALVLDTCRACMAALPARRPRRAGDVAAMLGGGRRWRRRWRTLAWASLGLALVGGVVVRAHPSLSPAVIDASGASTPPLLEITGRPADWTDVSRVLFTVQGRIRCLAVLPDRVTARVIWGSPGQAEDVNISTGSHAPSPLVPAAYKEGCPDLAPDGQRLLYQAYAEDGRAFAFVSTHPDGREGTPVVAVDDPSLLSEPKWLADGESFAFNFDLQHIAVYSLTRARATILPDPPTEVAPLFFHVLGMKIYLSHAGGDSTLVRQIDWPWSAERGRFRLPILALDLSSGGEGALFVSDLYEVTFVRPERQQARRIGYLRNRQTRFFTPVPGGAIFVSRLDQNDLWAAAHGTFEKVTHTGDVATAARCGTGFIVTRSLRGATRVERLSASGALAEVLTPGPHDGLPGCTPDGSTWFFLRNGAPDRGLYRCSKGGCTRLLSTQVLTLTVSPDGKRLAYSTLGPSGPRVRWMSADGGEPHEVSESESVCEPQWSSPTTIWVSRRQTGRVHWTEIDVDTGAPTGRAQRGASGCFDGSDDPSAPGRSAVRIRESWESQVRFLAAAELPR